MQQVGRYQITGELGRGAMGVVYRALDPAIGRTVALKSIRLADLADPDEAGRLRERLLREAQSAGALSHPGIVTIFDVAEEDDRAYVAMEFVNGPTLEQVLARDEAPDPKGIFRVLRETAAALDYAHNKGIVHRDIKPANIMLHEDGTAKITDFGVAKVSASQHVTQAGTVIGTPSYMSPEQIQGQPVDGRSDQFSLAVIAYEMLTGEKPFVAEPLPSLLYQIVHEQAPAPQRVNPTLGWPIEVVLRKALHKEPEERYATCSEFVAALEAACNSSKGWKPLPRGRSLSLPTSAVSVEAFALPAKKAVPAAEAPRPRRVLRRIAAAVGVLAALAVASSFVAWRQGWFTVPAVPAAAHPPGPPMPSAPTGRPSPGGPVVAAPKPETPAEEVSETTTPESENETQQPDTGETLRVPAPPTPAQIEPAPADAVVLVRTSPPGATVVFDSNRQSACKTPCSLSVAPGRHTALATLAGHRSALRIFEVPKESDLFFYLARMSGQVQVLSEPAGASILVNGEQRQEKTPATFDLPVGKYTIAVTKEGWDPADQQVEVRDSAFVRLNFRLSR